MSTVTRIRFSFLRILFIAACIFDRTLINYKNFGKEERKGETKSRVSVNDFVQLSRLGFNESMTRQECTAL